MHKIPVHLDTKDLFLWNLTFRQVLILFAGGGIAYLVGTTDWSTPLAALLCVLAGILCLGITCLLAFIKIAHRDLDQWLLVAFFFASSPHVYCWSPFVEEPEHVVMPEQALPEKGEEEW